MADAPRKARNPFKVAVSWAVGFITDPHTRATSAARMVGILATIALCAYVVICSLKQFKPDAAVCGELSGLICAALALRAKSTQEGRLPLTHRASDSPPAPPFEVPHA